MMGVLYMRVRCMMSGYRTFVYMVTGIYCGHGCGKDPGLGIHGSRDRYNRSGFRASAVDKETDNTQWCGARELDYTLEREIRK